MPGYALFTRYPFLKESVPRLELVCRPTPLETLSGLSRRLGGGVLLVKRDDLSHPVYGGNKPRKLEFLFAAALRKGCREVITAGGLGSHHVLAVAALGREVGLRTAGLFYCQPVNGHVRANLLLESSFGTEMHFVEDYAGVAGGYLRLYLSRLTRERRPPFIIMPGGSTALSALGYISAALELKEQLAEQGLPDPEAVFVAAGTGGTAAGLLAGLALAGMDTVLHAVRVVHPSILGPERVFGLARKALRFLAGRGVDTGEAVRRLPRGLRFAEEYLGEGYGFGTPESGRAIRMLEQLDGITLEGCYTGKAAAAFLDYYSGSGGRPSRPVVLVNTASSTHNPPPRALPPAAELPPSFSWCFDRSARRCRCGLRKHNHRFCRAVENENWRWE